MGEKEFVLPSFFNFPPYFTLQPVTDTQEKQKQLWTDLIIQYCKHHKIYVVNLEEDFPLFENAAIQRKLNAEARGVFMDALVSKGRGEWVDASHRKCLILWHRLADWAEYLYTWVSENAMLGEVMTVEEIQNGADSRSTELHGVDTQVLMRAIKLLEKRGKAALFQGDSSRDLGVKFF
mmetsp:Transcript_16688/g.23013  ORF Transcript_16688/g.23013 Transcript_16688/m.23013 type:complete len:178 (+) Transcript_16688:186-719(+)|eukprot:CAMPEP_0196594388 /NCGR_PEP_ID=MMETSP1081-20130531/78250_1 /TAXON_ID=36882 /ORGANISM="Pyramimonas amylifera, Strain CCMP720" /LENGTH=177 /DNA_ID=CAMNT_0041918647 /DNA_START=163 /DNA_END=696 /DNA_ORIENTATION=-